MAPGGAENWLRYQWAVDQYHSNKKSDFGKVLKRERTAIAMRLGEKHNDVGEGFVKFGHVSMLWTTNRKLGLSAFDHTRIAAQTACWQQGMTHRSSQALHQGGAMFMACLLNLRDSIGNQGDGMSETETVAIETARGC